MDLTLLLSILAGIVLLLILILKLRIPAFISLLISSIVVGILAGMQPKIIVDTVISGMGNTLGFVATVVGLGAMFGAILEKTGGARSIAATLLKSFGTKRSPWAMALTGFVVAIPVFFDVAFIILVPVIYALQKSSSKSLLAYAMPLLAGLGITHAFIPPTPGPVAVAEILQADLGWVILAGLIAGIPTLLVSGIWFGKRISRTIFLEAPEGHEQEEQSTDLPKAAGIFAIIGFPILLIILATLIRSEVLPSGGLSKWSELIGHPITALILANLIAWYDLGLKRGFTSKQLLEITGKSLAPAGTIILLTGAGGVFKEMLIATGGGKMMAESLTSLGIPLILFAFLAAAIIRVLQGSATVAMITGAGLVAPLLLETNLA
ncbi:MAG: gluconate transporter, partial [Saprospiraceae bacterium]|nr:gluconate transporter [Saprospiraceae bacterium]